MCPHSTVIVLTSRVSTQSLSVVSRAGQVSIATSGQSSQHLQDDFPALDGPTRRTLSSGNGSSGLIVGEIYAPARRIANAGKE